MIPGNPNPNAGKPSSGFTQPTPLEPNGAAGPPTPVDEEAHFRLDDHQRQIDQLKKTDTGRLVKAIGELVAAIRDLIATRKV